MNAPPTRPDRTLVVILSVIAALVVVSLAVVFSRGEPKQLDASTPEGVVQRYAAAVIAGDESAAAAYLTAEALDSCQDFNTAVTDNIRVTLVSTTERADSADVKVSIVTSYESGPFGASESESEDAFDLARIDGEWLIDRAPWQLAVCPTPKVTR